MKHSDRPIFRPAEDVLGRAPFSLTLARVIDGLSVAKDGFVIAVLGEWGSGKSSVIELIVRYLTHLEMERASQDALWGESAATPYSLDQIEPLAETFDLIKEKVLAYDALDLNFSRTQRKFRFDLFRSWLGSRENASKADTYWRLLIKINEQRRTTIVRFSPWSIAGRAELARAFLSELARGLGESLGSNVNTAFASLLQRLSEFAPVAGAGLDAVGGAGAGKILSAGITWSSKLANSLTNGPTLDDLRERLKFALRDLNDQRVLVIIDDLDRLLPTEAVEMVSLVKSLGDLPNLIYVLSYDEKRLASLINEGAKVDGAEYLSKIVQYSVHLPPVFGRGLSQLLDADLAELLGELSDDVRKRIGYTWHYVFQHYLRTPRDVRLYVNSVAVAISSQRDFVDPIDLLMLEVLRLHEPAVYRWVRENLSELSS